MAAALAIVQGGRPPQPTHPAFTEDVWALMQRCWDQGPRLRPEVQEVSKVLQASSASRPFLQQLRLLDRSLSGFHDQLTKVLYGEGYQQRVANSQGDDLVWLVDYLDRVCRHVAFPTFRSSLHRLSMILSPPVALSGSVCSNSNAYVALGGYSRHRTHFRLSR